MRNLTAREFHILTQGLELDGKVGAHIQLCRRNPLWWKPEIKPLRERLRGK
jgi:hypothetical protein